jgi:L-alanine-DL-glutamate epimerase-like enolase superfamily enzyme
MQRSAADPAITTLDVAAYRIPTDAPEADGTFQWDATTIVIVQIHAGDATGLGYSYADAATAQAIHDHLISVVQGRPALDIPGSWLAMQRAIRNLGRPGIAAMAISAVDTALWDLKARLLDLPLVGLLGAAHESVPIYGSGGFTTYSIDKLQAQLGGWAKQGIPRVKLKIGTHPTEDLARVRAARAAVGDHAQIYVDANGAYNRKQALYMAEEFAALGVAWFEEPDSADDLAGLHLLRDRAPAGMQIAAGEYGYTPDYFRNMLAAEAVDVLQADATRCMGISGFLGAATLAGAHHTQLSAHCAPALHLHPAAAIPNLWPIEYFHDHVRIENMLFDGVVQPVEGALRPDRSRPGMGLTLKQTDAQRFRIWG